MSIDLAEVTINPAAIDRIARALRPDHWSTEDYVCHAYAKSVDSISERRRPAIVVKPKTTEEVAEVVKIANEYHIPIVPRGNGTDLTQGVKPTKDGVMVMDLRGMDEIHLDREAGVVTVQAGVTWGRLLAHLMALGLYTGQLGPANSSGTVGGAVSNHSVGGGGEPMFGSVGENVVGLEVVLPTGDVITTGAGMSKFSKPWFGGRYLCGPDLTGIFIGDPGLLGVKTRITLRVYPMPPHFAAKTYLIPGDTKDLIKDARNAIGIFRGWEQGDYGLFALGYWNFSFTHVLGAFDIFSPLAHVIRPGEPATDGMLAMVSNAWTAEGLQANLREIEAVIESFGGKEFGLEISEGNWARWLLEKTGNWSYFHPAWGLSGAGPGCPVHVADAAWVDCERLLEETVGHYSKNARRFIDSKMAMSYMLTPVGGGAKLVWGYPSAEEIPEDESRKLRAQLIREQGEIIFRGGALPIWTGPSYSQLLVDIGAISDSYMSFLKGLKDHLDPNGILSPGKFYFNQ